MAKGMELRVTLAMLRAVGDAWSNLDKHRTVILEQTGCSSDYYRVALNRLKKNKLVKVTKKEKQAFIELTKEGVLKTLLDKTGTIRPKTWDGKYRMFIFDIPEDLRHKRDELRLLLKKHDFFKIQESVFVHPYPLNQEALEYLKEKGLTQYIRIARIDAFDDDSDIRKHFNL